MPLPRWQQQLREPAAVVCGVAEGVLQPQRAAEE
jgi:hypothetical protein